MKRSTNKKFNVQPSLTTSGIQMIFDNEAKCPGLILDKIEEAHHKKKTELELKLGQYTRKKISV